MHWYTHTYQLDQELEVTTTQYTDIIHDYKQVHQRRFTKDSVKNFNIVTGEE